MFRTGFAYMVTQIIGALLASAVLLGILSGVIGDSSAGIAEYSRAIHGLGVYFGAHNRRSHRVCFVQNYVEVGR